MVVVKKTRLLKNGLTQKASQITEYIINVENDSLDNEIKDTISITTDTYNKSDLITSKQQITLFAKDTIFVRFVYNEQGNIKKEIVKISKNQSSFNVNYFYKDTFLIQSKVKSKNEEFSFSQVCLYEYNSKNQLKKSSLKQVYVDTELGDTINNTLEINKYNTNKFVTTSHLTNYIKPERSKTLKYKYDCNLLREVKEYDYKDSLILKTKHNYEFDQFKNWIVKKVIVNNKLSYIKTRKIIYN